MTTFLFICIIVMAVAIGLLWAEIMWLQDSVKLNGKRLSDLYKKVDK